ncbi:MAG: FtsQ-type POTRA domain-containing protein [Pseudomonadota bacterium]
MRRGVGSAFAIGFMTMGLGYGAAMGGHGPIVVSALASTVGLQAQDIVITGQIETTETDVYRALGFVTNQSLVGFDADAARLRLKALPWVKDVAIRKLYPGKLTIAIAERRPMAVWQHEDRLTVVEETGRPIDRFGIADLINNRFGHLPHLVGKGASGAAADILPLVAAHPSIAQQVTSYVHVAERRWDIELAGGIRIKLPEKGVADALARAQSLNEKHALFEREIKTLDLRLKDRAIIALPEKAAKTRADFVSARQKAMKKADTKL